MTLFGPSIALNKQHASNGHPIVMFAYFRWNLQLRNCVWRRYKKSADPRQEHILRLLQGRVVGFRFIIKVKMALSDHDLQANVPSKAAAKPQHPKYTEMVEEACGKLNERNGSSRQAILKYIQANFPVGEQAESYVKIALRKGVLCERLIQTKGKGASGSFKLSPTVKKEAEKAKKSKEKAAKKAAKEPTKKKSKEEKENLSPNSEDEAKPVKAKKSSAKTKEGSEKKRKSSKDTKTTAKSKDSKANSKSKDSTKKKETKKSPRKDTSKSPKKVTKSKKESETKKVKKTASGKAVAAKSTKPKKTADAKPKAKKATTPKTKKPKAKKLN
ncbi:Histone H1-delta [Exaiptasia diaphana]|nr:Histone H1-delta [Exaiptasia diaphana]